MENNQVFRNFELPEKRGWLDKRSKNLIRRWQSRYFVLKNRILEYYYLVSDPSPAMRFNFNQVEADLTFQNSGKLPNIILSFSGCKQKLKLKAENEKSFFEWVEALNKHISDSRAAKWINLSVSS